jgi:DNA repair exonuclease SbcCD nuclease subunit
MVEYVKNENIKIVLMSGDVFDTATVTSDTISFVKDAFASAPECAFVISPGNHDPYGRGSVWEGADFGKNVYVFDSSEMSFFDFPEINVRVYGYAFLSDTLEICPAVNFTPEDSGRINILCAHAYVNEPLSLQSPITEKDIGNTGFDYCAFGHIHTGEDVKYAGNVPFAYSGCLMGRDFGETGEKGAVIITAEENKLSFEKRTFTDYRYVKKPLDLNGISGSSDIRARISNAVSEFSDTISLRLELVGQVPIDTVIDTIGLCEEYDSGVFYLEIEDLTTPLLSADMLENDPTIIGEFFREMKPLLENGTPDERKLAAKALRAGIAALRGEEIPI